MARHTKTGANMSATPRFRTARPIDSGGATAQGDAGRCECAPSCAGAARSTTVGTSAALMVSMAGLATMHAAEVSAGGMFAEAILAWTVIYAVAGLSAAIALVMPLCAYFSKTSEILYRPHVRRLCIALLWAVVSTALFFSMIQAYSDQFDGEEPHTPNGIGSTSNPRDRNSTWRSVHSVGCALSMVAVALFGFILAEVVSVEVGAG